MIAGNSGRSQGRWETSGRGCTREKQETNELPINYSLKRRWELEWWFGYSSRNGPIPLDQDMEMSTRNFHSGNGKQPHIKPSLILFDIERER